VDLVGSLGADRVVDYTQEDFTRTDRRYDLLLDVAGSRPWSACRSSARSQNLLVLGELLEAGTLTPVVERSYPLAEAAEALRYLGAGHARGKLAIVVGEPAREHGVDPAG
jgi:NADPH:quinone reductase-like Zn-dependent oxidoreductase